MFTQSFYVFSYRVLKHSKERLLILLAANIDGSEKLKPLIIGKSRKPHSFKNNKSFPMLYKAYKKA